MSSSLSIKVSSWLVGAGSMPRRCAATLPFLRKRHTLPQFSFLSWWRRRCGGRAWSGRYLSGLIGVKCFVRRNIPINPSRLILRIKHIIICGCMRCLPGFNTAGVHWGRRDWRRIRRLRGLGAVFFILPNHGHSSQHIEWVVRQVEVIEVGWQDWVLVTEPGWKCGFARVRVYSNYLWLRRGDGGDCDCFTCHSSWYLQRVEDCRSIIPDRSTFCWWALQIEDAWVCRRIHREFFVHCY